MTTTDEDLALPTFEVKARFAAAGETGEAAESDVRSRLTAARGLYDDVRVERQEPDGSWQLVVRFVVVSIDARTAVLGVQETLESAGVSAEEVWATPLELP